jgi:signal peptidase I
LRFEFHGLVLFFASGAILLGFILFVSLDALIGINKLRVTVLKPYHRWYYYVGILAAVLIINEVILEPILPNIKNFKPYRIRSSGMAPSLLVGDRLVADRKIYKEEKPKRDDVIIFEYPKDPSKDFLKRVIGLEGEKLEIVNNKVYINDKLIDDPWGYYESSGQAKYLKELENFGPVVVPKDFLFVLGDNRHNSMDSRFFGFVDITKVKGKALYIYWAKNMNRIGMEIK